MTRSLRSLFRRDVPPSAPSLAAPRETIEVSLPDGTSTEVLRVRDPRARRLKLLVSERGARLTLPRHASLREADRFLAMHLEWLAQQLQQRRPEPRAEPLALDEVASLTLRGVSLPLRWVAGNTLRVRCDSDALIVSRPDRASAAGVRRALKDFLMAEARRDVGQWLPRYLPGLPRAPRLVRVRPLRSLWGSLSPDDALSLDLALVLGPPAAFEYVLVHELCHLIHANHSAAFWREVEQRCPDWRSLRAWFRGEGLMLKQDLARLVAR